MIINFVYSEKDNIYSNLIEIKQKTKYNKHNEKINVE